MREQSESKSFSWVNSSRQFLQVASSLQNTLKQKGDIVKCLYLNLIRKLN